MDLLFWTAHNVDCFYSATKHSQPNILFCSTRGPKVKWRKYFSFLFEYDAVTRSCARTRAMERDEKGASYVQGTSERTVTLRAVLHRLSPHLAFLSLSLHAHTHMTHTQPGEKCIFVHDSYLYFWDAILTCTKIGGVWGDKGGHVHVPQWVPTGVPGAQAWQSMASSSCSTTARDKGCWNNISAMPINHVLAIRAEQQAGDAGYITDSSHAQ